MRRAKHLRPLPASYHATRLILLGLGAIADDVYELEKRGDDEIARLGKRTLRALPPSAAAIVAEGGCLGESLEALIASGVVPPVVPEGRRDFAGRTFAGLAQLLPKSLEIRERYPNDASAHQLVYVSAHASMDFDAARSALLAPLPPRGDGLDTLASSRARTVLALHALRGKPLEDLDLAPLLADLDRQRGLTYESGGLRGLALAPKALTADEGKLYAMARGFVVDKLPPRGHPARAGALNTAGILAFKLGEPSAARACFDEAERRLGNLVSAYNAIVLRFHGGARGPELRRALERLAQRAKGHRLHGRILAWCGHLAEQAGDDEAAGRRYADAVGGLDRPSLPGFDSMVGTWVHAKADLFGGFWLSSRGGVRLDVRLTPEIWLAFPAPLSTEEMRAKLR